MTFQSERDAVHYQNREKCIVHYIEPTIIVKVVDKFTYLDLINTLRDIVHTIFLLFLIYILFTVISPKQAAN